MDILLLTAPAQHAAENPSVETNPKRLKSWISQLPVMNVIETVGLLQNAIEPFNELQMPDAERLRLLEVYREAFDEILFFYDNARLHQLPIPAEQRKRLSDDIMWLYLGLASGYKTLVRNGFDSGQNPQGNVDLLLATYRSMELIIHALLYAYRVHETPPPLAYLEVYQLYYFAEFHQAVETRIKAVRRESVAPTIDRLFKQFLLLTVADPYKIDGHEIHELYMVLEPYATDCEVSADMSRSSGGGLFTVDFMEDSVPCFHEDKQELSTTPYGRSLDLTPALKSIEHRITEQQPDKSDFIHDQETRLLKLFIKGYEQRTGLKQQCVATNREIKIARGLSAIAYLLKDKDHLVSALSNKIEIHGGIEVSEASSEEADDVELSRWKLVDENDFGCTLFGDSRQFNRGVMIGDVLGLIDSEVDESGLIVGVIRSKRAEAKNQVKIGIEFLPSGPLPVVCYTKSKDTGQRNEADAIYFPRNADLNQPATLFAKNELYEQGEIIQAIVRGKSFNVQPGESVIDTPLYRQFKFSAVRDE